MDDYRAGNMEKAKQEFDQALATLLESGQDIQGDERLSSEFDKIVENVYSVEAASLERGDALSLHNYEPTPLESFSGLTFPVDPRTKERVQQELQSVHSDLPLVSNDAVDGVITYMQNHARGLRGKRPAAAGNLRGNYQRGVAQAGCAARPHLSRGGRKRLQSLCRFQSAMRGHLAVLAGHGQSLWIEEEPVGG